MKIEVWSDFVCPYCYLGKRHLELALQKFSHKNKVLIQFKSFQLNNPNEVQEHRYVQEALVEKYQTPISQIKKMNEQLRQQGTKVDITLNFDKLLNVGTFDTHRLVKYAATIGKDIELITNLFEAYFTNNENINDENTLISLAQKVGIDEKTTTKVMQTCKYGNSVREDLALAQEMNVQGVPFFVINEKYALTGAQPVETFLDVLETVWEDDGSIYNHPPKTKKTTYCHGADCDQN